ncbi:DUF3089 domain-containing protein [Algiphilus sp.]|uniref:DUF3089 domain-containing protein n=1 Tax=Algiphilus sp. TaxID=1872431 RepID=UPI0025BB145B|nr:DUF3089 domain-containing protein [Algiphilus sp.]MCK5769943.1 DUF3089 domain-containing protein [Algiphilus sp.]
MLRSRSARWGLWLAAGVVLTGCGGDGGQGSSDGNAGNPFDGYVSANYEGPDNWLCHPQLADASDVCATDLRSTSVAADGTASEIAFLPAADAPFDCFYVYPTTSVDPGRNSDFNPGAQERDTVASQFARYGEVCRTFAPVYRQITLSRLAVSVLTGPLLGGGIPEAAAELAYGDVLDAFRRYIAADNNGRGFVLVGHSQGSGLLRRLIAEVIEPDDWLHERLIGAHLMGTSVAVPPGADVGGDFRRTPACRAADQTGCVVSYASFRAGDPQLDDPRFGTTADPDTRALCTNPAQLAGGEAALSPQMPRSYPPAYQALVIPRGSGGPYASRARNLALDTPYFTVPEQIRAECVLDANGTSYLEIRIQADPEDPRADDYPGEFLGGIGWGLHLADVALAQQDLVDLAGRQGHAWLSR